jgi:hypothetical protein
MTELASSSEVDRFCGRSGLLSGRIDLGGCPAAGGAVRTDVVVIGGEAVELMLHQEATDCVPSGFVQAGLRRGQRLDEREMEPKHFTPRL